MIHPDLETIHIQAATYRRLIEHLMRERPGARNGDLMDVAGFCRDCLARWYREAAEARGITMTGEEAGQYVYGMPPERWHALYQSHADPSARDASPSTEEGAA